MTSFILDDNQASYQIRSFKPGCIQINDKIFTENLIITAHHLIENWKPQSASDIQYEHLVLAIDPHPDILIIGTGARQQFIPIEIYGGLLNQGIGIEMMDTAAACRTYNALTSENRKVAAALILR